MPVDEGGERRHRQIDPRPVFFSIDLRDHGNRFRTRPR